MVRLVPSNTRMRHWCSRVIDVRLRAALFAVLVAMPAGCAFGGPDLQSVADEFTAPSSWQALGDGEVTESLCIGPD